MSMTRRFHGEPVSRLIVSVPLDVVHRMDEVARGKHPARGNRSEFIRLAIAEKLERYTPPVSDSNQMIFTRLKECEGLENNQSQSNGGRFGDHGDEGRAGLRTEAEQADARGGDHAER